MDYSSTILLTPHDYLEWKPKILVLLRSRGFYQITMEIEVDLDFTNVKNNFLNKQDMTIGFICLSISLEIFHQVDDEEQDSTPNELWTILEVLFGNKEDCMQNIDTMEPIENPLEDQSSQFEEPST